MKLLVAKGVVNVLVNAGKMLKWIIHSRECNLSWKNMVSTLESELYRIYRVVLKQIKCDNDVSTI